VYVDGLQGISGNFSEAVCAFTLPYSRQKPG
jgi:rare lipoprotein A